MNIKVYAPPFGDHSQLNEEGCLTLEEGAVLGDVYRKLKFPMAVWILLISRVNYEKVKPMTRLKDGDIVSIFWPMAGG